MSITGLAIKRPILFIVFFLVLGGLSVMSYLKLKYELLPNLATPTITVITAYPGASPVDVENSVTKKIEDAVAGVSKSKKVNGTSSDNLSLVSIEFVADADPDQALQEVQRAVNSAVADFPAGVKAPVLEKFNVNDLPVLKLAVTANVPPADLYDLVNKRIKNRLAQVKGVGNIKILGGSPNEVRVSAKLDELKARNISITDLYEAVKNTNLDYPVGTVKDKDAQFGVRLAGKLTDTNQIKKLVVKNHPDGSSLYLGDVANVNLIQKDEEVSSRLNGKSSIALFINKQTGANAAEVAAMVRKELQSIEQDYTEKSIKFNVAQDSSEFTLAAARQVYDDLGIAVLLVALVMLIFLHSIRNSLIIMVSIPASLFSAFVMMYALDYSLNLMTLLAISLVIGVLVDDSIVVLENIYHHLEKGKSIKDAALEGRNEIGFSALAITLVDVVVFLPMALVPGLVGSLIKEFSLVIVVSTLSSLVVSFTLTPMIASRFAKLEQLNPASLMGKAGLWFEEKIHQLTIFYAKFLKWGLQHKLIVGFTAFTISAGSLSLMFTGIVGTEFLPAADKGELSLFIDLQPGTELPETKAAVKTIEAKLRLVPEITRLFSNIGYQNDGFNEKYASNVATINVSLVPIDKRERTLSQLSRQLKNIAMQVTGVRARVSPIGLFGANEAPVKLVFTGADRDSLNSSAAIILKAITPVEGLINPRMTADDGKPQMKLVTDPDQMAKLHLNTALVGQTLRMAVFGDNEQKFRVNGTETDTRIVLDIKDRENTAQLMNMTFLNTEGQLIYLSQFAHVVEESSPSELERRNRQPCAILLAQVSGRPVGDVGESIKNAINKLHISKGVKVLYEGDLELQDDSFTDLGIALLVSFSLVYLIMVVLYNDWIYPLVILFSIPLAICGALLALALTAKSMNVFSIFGLIMMMGLVVKNGILLVDKTNSIIGDNTSHASVNHALIEAGKARLRPILMTTLAMVIGMLPLALATGGSSAFSSGLAWVLIGGLSSSMFLTLIVVPVVYQVVASIKNRFKMHKDHPQNLKTTVLASIVVMGSMLGIVNNVHAQEVQLLSLKQAVAMGLQNNQQIKLAQLEAEKAKYGLKEAQSYEYPQISISTDYIRNIKPSVFFLPVFGINQSSQIIFDDSKFQAIPASAKNGYSGSVNLNMPIFNREVDGNVATAHLNENLNKANIEVSRWELADEIRKAYFNCQIARQNQQFTEAARNRAECNMQDSRKIFAKGYANKSDTLTASANVELMKINVNRALTAMHQSENYLKSLLNLSTGTAVKLTDTIGKGLLSFSAANLNDTLSVNKNNRPDLKANGWKTAIATQQIKTEKSKYLPSLGFVSQYMVQAQSDNFDFGRYAYPNSFYVGLQLTIPIFTGFRTEARVKQSRIALEEAYAERSQLMSAADLQMRNNRLLIQENVLKMKGLQSVHNARQQALDFIKARWAMGFAKYTDVADAELQLLQADNDYTQSVFDYLTAVAGYYKATGNIL